MRSARTAGFALALALALLPGARADETEPDEAPAYPGAAAPSGKRKTALPSGDRVPRDAAPSAPAAARPKAQKPKTPKPPARAAKTSHGKAAKPGGKQAAEVVSSSPPITVAYPPEGFAFAAGRSMFILGSVAYPRRPFRINGSTVAAHPKGGFLAYLPVEPGTFTFRCELDLPQGTTVWVRTIRVRESAPTPAADTLLILPESLAPANDVELRPGDWLNVRMRGTPGLVASFNLPGIARALPMAEAKPGTYEGAYQIRYGDRFEEADILMSLKGPGRSQVQAAAAGRLTVAAQPPGVLIVRSEGIVNVRSGPGQGYILFPPQGTRFLVTGRDGSEVRVRLSERLSGWIGDRALDWLPAGTPPPRAVLGDISLAATPDADALTLDLSQRIPFQVEESPDLSGLKLTLYGTTGHVNWIVYDPAGDFVRQVVWSQQESDVVEVAVRLAPGRLLWGYDASWRGAHLRVELRRPPKLAPRPASVLKGRIIVLDPGHGPSAPGAVGPRGTWEQAVNFLLAKDAAALLAKEGAQVVLTRGQDEDDVPLSERTKRAFARRGEIFVSLHNNALPDGDNPFDRPHGFSVFYYHPHSLALAESVYRAFGRHAPLPGEGLRYGNLYVARATQMPSILTESAYLMFPEQEDILLDAAKRRRFALAICEGIKDFLEGERRRQAAPAAKGKKP
ncbi:MAG: N-acetylmuramoyl-L-alanine amidase [Elusimicrobia bacterium]|nr:N-acetylmuramoyl-L-alanine amidase [Elusimicrobiota bacterium]